LTQIDKDLNIGMISCNKCHRELRRVNNILTCGDCNQQWKITKL